MTDSYIPMELSSINLLEYDYQLYTDGSGFNDGYGGYASLLLSADNCCFNPSRGAVHPTSTSRMEFIALTTGLRSLYDWLGLDNGNNLRMIEFRPPTILWVADREDLVKSVDTAKSGYGRKANGDLWAQFEYFERLFSIQPIYIPRETNAWHSWCDLQSHQCRRLIKVYIEEQP
jgi:hypothetical protein